MNKLIIIVVIALAAAWMIPPRDSTPQQRISAIQTQVAQAVQSAPAYAKAIKEAIVQVNQSQSATVQHSQVVANTPPPVSPRLQAWLEAEAERQIAERIAAQERIHH